MRTLVGVTRRPEPGAWRHAKRVLLAMLIGVAGALPLALRGPSCGQDFDFHLQSWLAVRAAWHSGLLVPHWAAAANYGAGEPRFLFYPPLSWLLGALLSFVLPWAWVPWAFTALVLAGLAWSMYGAAMRRLRADGAGTAGAWAAASVYALAPYMLFCAYERGALAELLAGVFLPPLLVRIAQPGPLEATRIALLVAALWYTNAPAAVMGCYLVLLAAAWRGSSAFRARGAGGLARVWVRAIAALMLGCALAADYLVPAWLDERFVSIGRAVGPGMRIRDSLLFLHTGEPYHDQVLHTASWIAVVTIAVGLLAAAGAWKGSRITRPAVAFLTLILLVCACMQFRPSLPVWNTLPELGFLQFPWRLLLPASAAACLLLGVVAGGWPGAAARRVSLALAVSLGIGLVTWAAITRFQPCDDEDNVAAQLLLPASGGFEGTDEYTAADSDNDLIQQGLPRVRLLQAADADEGSGTAPNPDWAGPGAAVPGAAVPGQVRVQTWEPERYAVQVRPRAPAFAVLRLARFADWQVRVNGAACGAACVPRDDGLLTIAMPPDRWTRISIAFGGSWRIRLGRSISLGALVLLLAAAALRARVRRRSAIMSRHVD